MSRMRWDKVRSENQIRRYGAEPLAEHGQARAEHVQQMQALVVDLDAGDIEAKLGHLVRHLGPPMGASSMAAKRKVKRTTPNVEDLSKPSKWRLQHGSFSEPTRHADPETGSPVQHRRAVDTLGLMLANGTITPEMHEAGGIFRATFRAAALDGMRTMPLLRVQGTAGDPLTERQAIARNRLAEALALFGGDDSAGGSCLWHVVGMECSLREWATRQGWAGRPVHHVQAQGILVTALGVLAVHYGLASRRRVA